MFINIQAIKNDTYIDETTIIDLESLGENKNNK